MNNFKLIIISISLITLSVSLVLVKQRVSDVNLQLKEINRQLKDEQATIHTLNAELSYLQSPSRIQVLANKYLNLETIQLSQIEGSSRLPKIAIASNKINLKSKKHLVNWRYKKAPTEYFRTVRTSR